MGRRPRPRHVEQGGLALRGGDSRHGPDLGVRHLAPCHGRRQARQSAQGPGHPDVLPGRSEVQPDQRHPRARPRPHRAGASGSGTGARPPYVFKHALTQDVAYDRLSSDERRRLHAALEGLYAGRLDEVADRLAHHFSRADEHPKAVEYLMRFGATATASYALVEAVSAFQTAIAHAERLANEREREAAVVSAVTHLMLPLLLLGRIEEDRDTLLRYRERVERLGEPTLAGPYYFSLAVTNDHLGDLDAAHFWALRAAEAAAACGDVATRKL